MDELSIVIPAKNEEKYIGLLLESILNQDYPLISRTPVIVADADSTDKTREIIFSYKDRLPIKIVKGGLPSVGRNSGARESQSKYLLFIDADVELADEKIIRKTLERMKERKLYCATTNIRCRQGDFLDNFFYGLNNFFQRLSRLDRPFATGMFLAMEREIFEKLGGFDERVQYAEDYFLTKKVNRRNFGIVPGFIFTSNRRFEKMGHFTIAGFFLKTMLNKGRKDYFLNFRIKDYWK